jgi:peroxiredoxin Q/BCP
MAAKKRAGESGKAVAVSVRAGKRGKVAAKNAVGKKVAARAPAKKVASKASAAAPKASAAMPKASAAMPKAGAKASKASAAAPKASAKASKTGPSVAQRPARAPAPAAARSRSAKPQPSPAATTSSASGPGVGDRAPSFALQDQSGQTLSSDELAGKPYVIYFYPKDDTPGCTTQACGFRDTGAEFDGAGVRVIGVSPDSVASHQRFAGKYGLSFTLLSDPKQELATHYGVWAMKKNYGREYMGIVRSTFLVDADGVIRKAWRSVRVNGHVAEVHAAAAALG